MKLINDFFKTSTIDHIILKIVTFVSKIFSETSTYKI